MFLVCNDFVHVSSCHVFKVVFILGPKAMFVLASFLVCLAHGLPVSLTSYMHNVFVCSFSRFAYIVDRVEAVQEQCWLVI